MILDQAEAINRQWLIHSGDEGLPHLAAFAECLLCIKNLREYGFTGSNVIQAMRDLWMIAHPHHWLLESPNGPLALAVCRDCGTKKELPNVFCEDREGRRNRGVEKRRPR